MTEHTRGREHPFRIRLVNPPFAALATPSLALTQLRSRLRAGPLAEQVEATVHYLNIDFAEAIGRDLYAFVAESMEALNCGVGDWIFRQAAFSGAADNAQEYCDRYGHHLRGRDGASWWSDILDVRARLDALLDELIDRHALDRADIVGFTTMFGQNAASFALARKLKARNPALLTVVGGANCEAPMGREIARRVNAVDYVFSGPALVSFPAFVRCCLDGDLARCAAIDGVCTGPHRTAPPLVSGKFRVIPGDGAAVAPLGQALDINHRIDLDYDDFLDRLARAFDGRIAPVLFLETSRGCWWGEKAHCTFCGLNGSTMKYLAMDPPLALDQFRALFRHAGRVSEVQCVDNIMPKEYVRDVFPFLETPRGLRIFYEVKADLTGDELATLARAGVTKVQPGIESLATSTLKLMKKGTSAFQNIQFLKHCARHGIDPSWNLLIGFPGEEDAVYRKYLRDLPSLVHLPPPAGVFPIRFDRYSPYFTRAGEYGLELQPLDFYSFVYPFAPESLANLAYYFADTNALAPYALAAAKWLNRLRDAVRAWSARWDAAARDERPLLKFQDDASYPIVVDTRAGTLVRHDLPPIADRVADHLCLPRRMEDILRHFATVPEDEVTECVSEMRARGLLFEEDDRLISLVLRASRAADPTDTAAARRRLTSSNVVTA
jgi:ribosomal peptide maturation radical SAM protein 1